MRQIGNKFWRDQEDATPAYSAITTTSGLATEWLVTGLTQNVDLLSLHSYQIIADPTGINVAIGDAYNTVSGSVAIQVSFDEANWSDIFTVNITDNTKTGVLYSDTWSYPFSRTLVGGMVNVSETGAAAGPHDDVARSGAFTVRENHIAQ